MPYKAQMAAKPSKQIFDPFNSSATGHQRADNRLGGSTSWRDSRSLKLREQFSGGSGGGKRMNDTVGAGSLDFGQDGRTENGGWEKGAKGLRTAGQQSIWESMKSETRFHEDDEPKPPPPPQIFANLTIYLNGCTAPLSDHKLKHLISTHGGNMSISLGRRTVTHVILGKINANGGCGGGLAGTKIQKEIASLRAKSVKFVTAEWIVDSIKAGKRLPESRYEAMKLAPKGVANISTLF
ncbi:uncharacterized protein SEPMUDRAFT_86379, partial [Sphaerulina musiva SO2202]